MGYRDRPSRPTRAVIGENIKRIREVRNMTVRDLSARLKEVGLPLSSSGVSEVEHGTRKIGVDELLVIAIALNTSIIEFICPHDHSPLQISDKLEAIQPWRLEPWLRGDDPASGDEVDVDDFYEASSERRRARHDLRERPDLKSIISLETLVQSAIDGLGHIHDPAAVASRIKRDLDRVNSYVELLLDEIETNGDSDIPGRKSDGR